MDRATAVGNTALATGTNSTAIGQVSTATSLNTTAIGVNAEASATGATAVGVTATASGSDSSVLGSQSTASGFRSNVFGNSSTAAFDNSTAIGAVVNTTREDQMMFGNTTNTYTTPGITSAASTAAQTGPVELVTSDAGGNLATMDPATLGIASTTDADRNTEGVAMAMALSGIPNILPDDATIGLSVNWGNFDGENAVAFGGTARVTDHVFFNGGGAVGSGGQNPHGGRAGVTIAW